MAEGIAVGTSLIYYTYPPFAGRNRLIELTKVLQMKTVKVIFTVVGKILWRSSVSSQENRKARTPANKLYTDRHLFGITQILSSSLFIAALTRATSSHRNRCFSVSQCSLTAPCLGPAFWVLAFLPQSFSEGEAWEADWKLFTLNLEPPSCVGELKPYGPTLDTWGINM